MQKPQGVTFKKKSFTWSTLLTHKAIKHSNLFKIDKTSPPSTRYPKILVPTTQIPKSTTKNKRKQSIDNQSQGASPYSRRQRGGARKAARQPERTSSGPNQDTRHQIDRRQFPIESTSSDLKRKNNKKGFQAAVGEEDEMAKALPPVTAAATARISSSLANPPNSFSLFSDSL